MQLITNIRYLCKIFQIVKNTIEVSLYITGLSRVRKESEKYFSIKALQKDQLLQLEKHDLTLGRDRPFINSLHSTFAINVPKSTIVCHSNDSIPIQSSIN